MYRIILFLLCWAVFNSDSVAQEFLANDTVATRGFINRARSFFEEGQYDSTHHYADLVLSGSEEPDFFRLRYEASKLKFQAIYWGEDFNRATIDAHRRHLVAAEKAGVAVDSIYELMTFVYLFNQTGGYDSSHYYLDWIRNRLEPGDTSNYLDYHLYLANLYDIQELHEQALPLRFKHLDLITSPMDTSTYIWSLYNMAYTLAELERHAEAEIYLQEGIDLNHHFCDTQVEFYFAACLGICEIELGKFYEGVTFLEHALEIGSRIDKEMCCGNLAYLARGLIETGRAREAAPYLSQVEAELPGVTGPDNRINALLGLKEGYEQLQNWEKAFRYGDQLLQLKDSLHQLEVRAEVLAIESRYQNRELSARLEQQQLWFLLGGGALLILGLFGAVYYRSYRHRKKLSDDLKFRNDELQLMQNARSRFFQNLAHELRTPLTLASAPLQDARAKVRDKETSKLLSLAAGGIDRLREIIRDVLDFGRAEFNRLPPPKPSVIHLHTELTLISQAFESLAAQRDIELTVELRNSTRRWLHLDLDRLQKITYNLLDNAIKYAVAGDRVNLTAQAEGKNWTLSVSDTGPGIAAEDQKRIFERYYRVKSDRDELRGGIGIGLAYSQELAQSMGGNLSLTSTLGEGSTFTLILPVSEATPQSTKTKATSKPVEKQAQKASFLPTDRPHVLLVEDHVEMRDYLLNILGEEYRVDGCPNGKAALNHLERSAFDLVVSDLMMPEMDGLALLKALRSSHTAAYQHIPFIILTARDLEADQLTALSLGVDDYILKPFDRELLMRRIANILQRSFTRNRFKLSKEESAQSESFRRQLEAAVFEGIAKLDFDVPQLAGLMHLSQRQLERKVKAYTGFTPVGLIRELKLTRARNLLRRQTYESVGQVMEVVGYSNHSTFSRAFKARFGIAPSEFLVN